MNPRPLWRDFLVCKILGKENPHRSVGGINYSSGKGFRLSLLFTGLSCPHSIQRFYSLPPDIMILYHLPIHALHSGCLYLYWFSGFVAHNSQYPIYMLYVVTATPRISVNIINCCDSSTVT